MKMVNCDLPKGTKLFCICEGTGRRLTTAKSYTLQEDYIYSPQNLMKIKNDFGEEDYFNPNRFAYMEKSERFKAKLSVVLIIAIAVIFFSSFTYSMFLLAEYLTKW